MRTSTTTTAFFRVVVLILFTATFAWADWDFGDPYKMHYPQLPDLTPTGMDVLATVQPGGSQYKILADDWQCIESGPVHDIHIWGSWLDDQVSSQPVFKLSIHSDIPAFTLPSVPYSQPGNLLWSAVFSTGYSSRQYATGLENFFDPNLNQVIGTDTQIWQYNFTNLPNPFVQQVGTIYWLDVQVLSEPGTYFGWKTTNPLQTPHFMDDAVFADTAGFNGPLTQPWAPMVYPVGHPFEGQSIDLAFVITPEPASLALLGAGTLLGLLRRR